MKERKSVCCECGKEFKYSGEGDPLPPMYCSDQHREAAKERERRAGGILKIGEGLEGESILATARRAVAQNSYRKILAAWKRRWRSKGS